MFELKKGMLVRIQNCSRSCRHNNHPQNCVGKINWIREYDNQYTVTMLDESLNYNNDGQDCGYWLERAWILPLTSKRIK